MTTQAFLIFDDAQRQAAEALNDAEILVLPREINNSLANQLGEGTLVGKFVVGARLLNDPDYARWSEMCSTLPIRTMDSDVLFLPTPSEA